MDERTLRRASGLFTITHSEGGYVLRASDGATDDERIRLEGALTNAVIDRLIVRGRRIGRSVCVLPRDVLCEQLGLSLPCESAADALHRWLARRLADRLPS